MAKTKTKNHVTGVVAVMVNLYHDARVWLITYPYSNVEHDISVIYIRNQHFRIFSEFFFISNSSAGGVNLMPDRNGMV